MGATIFSDFWHQLVVHHRQWLFLVLAGFLGSFMFIRTSTRLMRSPRVPWWPGSVVTESGVHLHHLVWGIVMMTLAGTISFGGVASPVYEICAALFGVGMGLTIDEFALWVHLEDVYWAREGRRSVDVAVIALVALGLLVLGVRVEIKFGGAWDLVAEVLVIVLLPASVAVCLAKRRVAHALAGVALFPLALYAALRLGKPQSPWAGRFYGERNPRKQAKAERRFAPERRTERFKERLRDVVGGVTEEDYAAKLAQQKTNAAQEDATLAAAEEIRHRAERVGTAERR